MSAQLPCFIATAPASLLQPLCFAAILQRLMEGGYTRPTDVHLGAPLAVAVEWHKVQCMRALRQHRWHPEFQPLALQAD